ncbi:MAG: hypothetical protein CMH83_19795 [Nocardioides sp.]|nr:hypothetical protein [Nocardioides sp.]
MSVDLHLDGDPADCHRAAAGLRALHHDLARGARVLARASASEIGVTTAYDGSLRADVAATGRDVEAQAALVDAVATGLSRLAAELAEVATVLDRARSAARAHGLRVVGDRVLPPGPGDPPGAVHAHDRVRRVVQVARGHEEVARARWRAVLAAARWPSDAPSRPPLPDLPDPPGGPWPPPEGALPGERRPRVPAPPAGQEAPAYEPGLRGGDGVHEAVLRGADESVPHRSGDRSSASLVGPRHVSAGVVGASVEVVAPAHVAGTLGVSASLVGEPQVGRAGRR